MTPDLLVTGTPRSGTSLLDKLLSAHPEIAVLSQPLPRLYIAIKRAFLQDPSPLERAFPLNDLFAESYRPPANFETFLTHEAFDPGWLAETLAAMQGHPAQLVRPRAAPEALVPDGPVGLAAFVAHYLAAHAPPGPALVGSKEIVAEEFIGYFLAAGTRVLQTIRDPRDVAASVFGGSGEDHAGRGLPLLFVLRQWRKSVAFALHHAAHPGLRILRYEDLVTDPDAALRPIAGWLGCGSFPEALAARPLADAGGTAWRANSSHGAKLEGVSVASVGTGARILPPATVAAIETLCAPEMRMLGYSVPPGPADLHAVLAAAADPCRSPRPELQGYRWTEAALAPEQRRLEGLRSRRFERRLYLSPRVFRRLLCPPAAVPTPWRVAHGGRGSSLLYDLACRTRPGVFLLPANICPEVPLALAKAGHGTRLVDIDPETCAMQTEAALRIVRADTGAVAGVVHARGYGAIFDAGGFFAALRATDPGILIVDDRCACRPMLDPPGIRRDNDADVLLYSTGYGKYADLGGGGYAFLAPQIAWQPQPLPFDAGHAAAVFQALKAPEGVPATTIETQWPHWLETRPAYGSWPAMRTALAAEREAMDVRKARVNAIYRAAVPPAARLGAAFEDWRFCLCTEGKDALLTEIFAAGAFASGHFRPTAERLGGTADAPVASGLYRRVVNLFNDRHINRHEVRRIAGILRRHFADTDFSDTGRRMHGDATS